MRAVGDFWVGDRLVRPSLGEVRLGLEKVRVEPRSISVLIELARRPREVRAKEDLIASVWGDAFVSDEVLTHAIWDLRRAFGDNASRPEFIQTIPKRGYRLIAPVRPATPDDLSGVWQGLTDEDLEGPGARGRAPAAEPAPAEPAAAEPAPHPAPAEPASGGRRRRRVASLVAVAAAVLLLWLGWSDPGREAREIWSAWRDVRADELSRDPDIVPWIAGFRDPRAVRDFLAGVRITYRNEQGADVPMRLAMERDPDFVAPRVWRAPAVAAHGSRGDRDALRRDLDRLYRSASLFEKPMIRWALAILDGSPAEQVRYLKVALDQQPGHRIVRMVLGQALLQMGRADDAWRELEPLLRERWHYPGLYTISALCALERGAIFDLEGALEVALDNDPVDPEVFDLLRVLACYRGDPAARDRYEKRLAERRREMFPEAYRFDVGPVAAELAARAETEGRPEIAERLREFVD